MCSAKPLLAERTPYAYCFDVSLMLRKRGCRLRLSGLTELTLIVCAHVATGCVKTTSAPASVANPHAIGACDEPADWRAGQTRHHLWL